MTIKDTVTVKLCYSQKNEHTFEVIVRGGG